MSLFRDVDSLPPVRPLLHVDETEKNSHLFPAVGAYDVTGLTEQPPGEQTKLTQLTRTERSRPDPTTEP